MAPGRHQGAMGALLTRAQLAGAASGTIVFASSRQIAVPSKTQITSATPNARARFFGSITNLLGVFDFMGLCFL